MPVQDSRAEERTAAAHAPAATGGLLRRIVGRHVRPHAGSIALAVLLMAVTAACTALLAERMEPVIDDVFTRGDREALRLVALQVLALFIAKGSATYGQSVIMNRVGQRIVADLQKRMFANLLRADLAFFHDTASGGLVSRFISDVDRMRGAVSTVLTGIGRDSLTLAFLVAMMFYQDWLLALAAFFAFPAAVWPIRRIGRRMRKVSSSTQAEMGELTGLLSEVFQGVRHVKAYGMEPFERQRAEAVVERLYRLVVKAARTRALVAPLMEMLGGLAIVLVIVYGGWQVIEGGRTAGSFFSFVTALLLAYEPMKRLATLNANLQEGLAAAERVFALVDLEPRILDRPGAEPLAVRRGRVAFEDVHFAYRPDAPALRGVDLVVEAGQRVALVGPSGAGKSTILNLIPRFFDPDRGRITIDGTDIRTATIASLRASLALVSQETTLFNDTVRANIAYGRPDADETAIHAAARAAAADDFIRALPQGYDTVVGEHGTRLSGGQRQRLAIARAMLKDAPILLLDEATSALDSESERQVQEALAELMRGRTTLVVAHRLSTVADADLICVVADGRIVERGTHAELLALGGHYAHLRRLQSADEPVPAVPLRARA